MAQQLHLGTLLAASTTQPSERPTFLLHRVKCPKCGQSVWFTLRSDCSPEEVDAARRWEAQRLLREPCERHAGRSR